MPNFKKVKPTGFNFDDNPLSLGYIIDRKPNQGEFGSTQYSFMLVSHDGQDLKQVRFFANDILDDRLKTLPIELKHDKVCLIKIQYIGIPPGKRYKMFEVESDLGWRKGDPVGEIPAYKGLENLEDEGGNGGNNTYQPAQRPQPANQPPPQQQWQQPPPQQQQWQQPPQQQQQPVSAHPFQIDPNGILKHPQNINLMVDKFGQPSKFPVMANSLTADELPKF